LIVFDILVFDDDMNEDEEIRWINGVREYEVDTNSDNGVVFADSSLEVVEVKITERPSFLTEEVIDDCRFNI
jgi:hypothetical protein